MLFVKNLIRLSLIIAAALLMNYGCTINYLQESEAEGPPIRNLIKITQEPEQGRIDLRGTVSVNTQHTHSDKIDGHTMVDGDGRYRVEPVAGKDYFIEYEGVNTKPFTGENFTWRLPDWQGKAELDFSIFDNVSFTAGASVSSVSDNTFLGTSMGMAFKTATDDWGMRLDFGMVFQQIHFAATYINTTSFFSGGKRTVYIVTDEETDWQRDFTFATTVNTLEKRALVNYFFHYAFGMQSFFDFEGQYGNRYELTQFYHSLSLGVYKDISEKFRILLGVRGTQYSDDQLEIFIPDVFLQYDLRIF